MRNIGEDSLNEGIAWLYVYYDEKGVFSLKRFKGYEIIPGWKDADEILRYCDQKLYELQIQRMEEEKQKDRRGYLGMALVMVAIMFLLGCFFWR